MAKLILALTVVVSFFYLKEFRLHLFLLGVATAVAVFAYGFYLLPPSETHALRYTFTTAPHLWLVGSFVDPGWLQGLVANAQAGHAAVSRSVAPRYGWGMLGLAALALGLLFTSQLNRRLVIGIFIVGWIGLVPYSYEPFASATHPPMNWGFASERSGFYYEVSREQYPKSLPTLIRMTFGKAIGVVARDTQLDATIGLPDYFPRLWKTFYYYGDNLQQNFTVPLIFLTLAILFYLRRCDWPQVNWLIFLAAAFFLLGFMLLIIAPQEGFDFERNLQYKVFHLQSHCIFALMTYLHELMPEVPAQTGVIGFGVPAIFLSLLPLWSNFDGCSQAGHWFGYDYGADMMRPMDRNAVYFGGSDPGRFVPTFMAFVESQQDNRWKREPAFDRRDVTVITQNALCDTYYSQYIRNQYDPRFRPTTWTPFERWLGRDKAYPQVPVTCVNNDELLACWDEYERRPDVAARLQAGGAVIRPGTNDVFDINGIVAKKIFEKNKKNHTFYIEQSVPLDWMYPYLQPSGLIFKLSNEPLSDADFKARGGVAEDRKFWDAYSRKLLADPRFRLDSDAVLAFGKLAFWHADLYRWRRMDDEQEYWLRLSLALCPQLQDAVSGLVHLLIDQKRFDEAIAIAQQAASDDPRNDAYHVILDLVTQAKLDGQREEQLRLELARSPYDVPMNLDLARVLEDEGKFAEVNDRLRTVAGLTNWSQQGTADIVRYYVDQVHNPAAAIAFLEVRAKIDPTADKLIYSLAALDSSSGRRDDALKYLAQAVAIGGTNAILSAKIDPRFLNLRDDPGFQTIVGAAPATNSPATNLPATNSPATHQSGVNLPATNPPRALLPKPANR
jgi:tetratricopeptide (TPR) repeat protein